MSLFIIYYTEKKHAFELPLRFDSSVFIGFFKGRSQMTPNGMLIDLTQLLIRFYKSNFNFDWIFTQQPITKRSHCPELRGRTSPS